MNVHESPTDETLLLRLQDPLDQEAWYEFAAIYRPMVCRIGRRLGLQDADAENLAQVVLNKVSDQAAKWDTGKPPGSFRRWLSRVAKNAAIDAIRQVKPDAARGGTSLLFQLQQVEKSTDLTGTLLRLELEREAFRWAANRIREEFTVPTWSAFWDTMVEGKSCGKVAEQLGKSVGAIYIARTRVVQRLKVELEHFNWDVADEVESLESTL